MCWSHDQLSVGNTLNLCSKTKEICERLNVLFALLMECRRHSELFLEINAICERLNVLFTFLLEYWKHSEFLLETNEI